MPNLLLQGLTPNPAAIQQIADAAHARHVIQINTHAWCCQDARNTEWLEHSLEPACAAQQLDAYVITHAQTLADFKLLVMDMDSTLITIECIDEIAALHNLKAQVAAITEASMQGKVDFAESLKQRVALLAGLPALALEKIYTERVRLSPGAQTLIEGMRAAGLKILLVSGGFTFFTERLKKQLALDFAHANQLEIVGDTLTGNMLGTLIDAEQKKRIVQDTCQALGISTAQTIVIGDGANDLPMLRSAGLSVAYRAKPIVRQEAELLLNFSGLDGVLNRFAIPCNVGF